MHKQDDVRAAVIARLWQLCDGATPETICDGPCEGQRSPGICVDITYGVDGSEYPGAGRNLVQNALTKIGFSYISLDYWEDEIGNERRTLAGFLAAWLEDEQP